MTQEVGYLHRRREKKTLVFRFVVGGRRKHTRNLIDEEKAMAGTWNTNPVERR